MPPDAPGRYVNPYIAGSAVSGAEMFFGREDVFAFIRRNLVGRHSNHPIVLFGQRRTGKTSVLYQLHRYLDPEYWCIFIDLHGLNLDGLGNLMQGIASVISRELRRDHQVTVEVPERSAFLADPAAAFEEVFLDRVWAVLGGNQLVLMLDEAVRLDEEMRAGRLDRGAFEYLRHLMQHHKRLNFVFSLGSGIEEMSRDYAFLFSVSLYHRISFLEPSDARDLVTRPAHGHYELTDQAVDRILQITSGHPYYTQLVCHCLFDAWARNPTATIDVGDVDGILAEAIELGSANLTYVWMDSTPAEQVLIAGIAAAMQDGSLAVTTDQIRQAWHHVGVDFPDQEITRAVRSLAVREVITGSSAYSFTVDLQRLWLDKHRRPDWVREDLAAQIAQWKLPEPTDSADRSVAEPDNLKVAAASASSPGDSVEAAQRLRVALEAPVHDEPERSEPEVWTFDPSLLGRLYQPVLFVGLGGTGCAVGVELERRMRDAICGPDGNSYRKQRNRGDMLPFQLPSCVQFVYADLNEAELERLASRAAPGPAHQPAVRLTASYVRDLLPRAPSYPELARNLRLLIPAETASWLPPAARDEPRITPLQKGAGQLPTVGRAALFGSFAGGITPAVQELRTAVGRLATSGEDLFALGGHRPQGVDVFVAFSVAGGTGAGIFYDYLHLIADTVAHYSQLRVRLYPLVLMPSAFPEGLGGGRSAELNAARALLDLFRLVDQQNGTEASLVLRGAHDRAMDDPDQLSVSYPGGRHIVMPPGTMQTAFLFSQPAGATRDDMHRSVVSLVMSLVGTEMSPKDSAPGEHYHSFADDFANMGADRETLAEDGIGNRGVSTALVASLTVPVDELSSIVGAHLLAAAVRHLMQRQERAATPTEDIKDFVIKAGLHDLLDRPGAAIPEAAAPVGARAVDEALRDRGTNMKLAIDRLNADLGRRMPELAAHFNPVWAARDLLGHMDVFRLQRITFWGPGAANDGGVHGFLLSRTARPEPPVQGLGDLPPDSPMLKDRFLRRVGWNDEAVVAARNLQDAWYGWQTQVAWAVHWNAQRRTWNRQLEQLQRDLTALTMALTDFANRDDEDFSARLWGVYRRRVGVSYLLPRVSGIELFYEQLVRRIREQKAREEALPVSATDAQLVEVLIGDDSWREAYRISVDETPEDAVSYLREQVQRAVKRFLREPPAGEQPLLPRLHDLLTAAAGYAHGPDIQQDHLTELPGKLAGLIPASFNPQGSGPMKVLINYPADAKNPVVEGYLRDALNLPAGHNVSFEYRHTTNEALSVVLFRTSMGITEVQEVRHVLRAWAEAQDNEAPIDRLRWRQRTGYDFGYLATSERHRVAILHRILCALWNGKGTIHGSEGSPDELHITFSGNLVMSLPLKAIGHASSWGNLLRAYELWTLHGGDLHRGSCSMLLKELPAGLASRPKPPGRLYTVIRDLAAGQVAILDQVRKGEGNRYRDNQMHRFWADTLPAALDREFTGVSEPTGRNLRELERQADVGNELI